MEITSRYYCRILPRSSLARYYFIDIGGGVIDSDFRGELIVIMFNHSNKPYEVKVNDRIAQIIMKFQSLLNAVNYQKLIGVRELSAPQVFRIL